MKKDGGYGVDETHTNQSRATEVGHVYLERLEEGGKKEMEKYESMGARQGTDATHTEPVSKTRSSMAKAMDA
jgi:hypothetical protein